MSSQTIPSLSPAACIYMLLGWTSPWSKSWGKDEFWVPEGGFINELGKPWESYCFNSSIFTRWIMDGETDWGRYWVLHKYSWSTYCVPGTELLFRLTSELSVKSSSITSCSRVPAALKGPAEGHSLRLRFAWLLRYKGKLFLSQSEIPLLFSSVSPHQSIQHSSARINFLERVLGPSFPPQPGLSFLLQPHRL